MKMMCKIALLAILMVAMIGLVVVGMNTQASTEFSEVIGEPGEPGTILIGTLPTEPDPNKPVLVFVQGLNNHSGIWYEDNNMYMKAQEAGYETVFVELYDSGGTAKSYWDNGAMLANQLEQISDYFDGKEMVIVGYSKGGIDAQAALIHYGKHDLVEEVMTIGSPHSGSELADLAHSAWAGWLAELIGARSEGTESLQTGNMNHFRSMTDERWEVNENEYLTIAGDRAGPLFSTYFLGGLYISGPSDGVVSVESAHLPYGDMLMVGDWNHGEVHYGSNAFPVFQPYLTPEGSQETIPEAAIQPEEVEEISILLRGGKLSGVTEETFHVESGVRNITLDWMSTEKLDQVEMVNPQTNETKEVEVRSVPNTDFFEGAWHNFIHIDDPEVGEWEIRTHTSRDSAYLLVVSFDSPLNQQLKIEEEDGTKKQWQVKSDFATTSGNAIELDYMVNYFPTIGNQSKQDLPRRQQFSDQNIQSGKIQLPEQGQGSYNATIDIKGQTSSGEPFERTAIRTIYVDDKGKAY